MRVPLLAETSLAAQQLGDEFIVRDVVACICVDEKTVRERGAPDLGQNRYLQSYGKQMDPTGRRELDYDGGDAQPAAGRGSLVRHPRHRGPESSASDRTATNSAADIPTAAVEPPVIELCHPTEADPGVSRSTGGCRRQATSPRSGHGVDSPSWVLSLMSAM